jgi:hypothetical protein
LRSKREKGERLKKGTAVGDRHTDRAIILLLIMNVIMTAYIPRIAETPLLPFD